MNAMATAGVGGIATTAQAWEVAQQSGQMQLMGKGRGKGYKGGKGKGGNINMFGEAWDNMDYSQADQEWSPEWGGAFCSIKTVAPEKEEWETPKKTCAQITTKRVDKSEEEINLKNAYQVLTSADDIIKDESADRKKHNANIKINKPGFSFNIINKGSVGLAESCLLYTSDAADE